MTVTPLALILAGCSEAESTTAPSSEPAAVEPLADVRALLERAVKATRAGEDTARRKICVDIATKLDVGVEPGRDPPADRKLAALRENSLQTCPEAFETLRLLTAAAEPKVKLPPLSASFAAAFNQRSLETAFDDAKKAARRGEDPMGACARVRVVANALDKRRAKKARRTIRKALSYCEGPAVLSGIATHVKEAERARRDRDPRAFSEHCSEATLRLTDVGDGERFDRLRERAEGICLEAFSLQARMDNTNS